MCLNVHFPSQTCMFTLNQSAQTKHCSLPMCFFFKVISGFLHDKSDSVWPFDATKWDKQRQRAAVPQCVYCPNCCSDGSHCSDAPSGIYTSIRGSTNFTQTLQGREVNFSRLCTRKKMNVFPVFAMRRYRLRGTTLRPGRSLVKGKTMEHGGIARTARRDRWARPLSGSFTDGHYNRDPPAMTKLSAVLRRIVYAPLFSVTSGEKSPRKSSFASTRSVAVGATALTTAIWY